MTLKIHFYGHASLALEGKDQAIFFHPNWSPSNLFYTHTVPPLPDAGLFEKTTAIILSSGSYDHCDLFSFKYFSNKTPLLAPKGLAKLLGNHLQNPLVELAGETTTSTADLVIESTHTTHGMNLMRPFRGCAPLNYYMRWQGKSVLGLFHPPRADALDAWQRQDIDILFVSLGETPVPFFWTEFFAPKPILPSDLEHVMRTLAHAKIIVPIGFGGFARRSGKTPSLYEHWQRFLDTQSPELVAKVRGIEPGRPLLV